MDRVFRISKSDRRYPFPCKVVLEDREVVFGHWSWDETGYAVAYWDPIVGIPQILNPATARVRYRQVSHEAIGEVEWLGDSRYEKNQL